MIEPGQIYTACNGSGVRIRIIEAPVRDWLGNRATVETVLADGRGVRRRSILTTELHQDAATPFGKVRRTGWIIDWDLTHATPDSAGHERTPADTRPDTPDIRAGQVWQDCDPRAHNRQIRIVTIDSDHAVAELITPRQVTTLAGQAITARPGRRTRIRLDRFQPTKTGYRLVQDAPTDSDADSPDDTPDNRTAG